MSKVGLALTCRLRCKISSFRTFNNLVDQRREGLIYTRKQNKKGEEVGGIVPHVTRKSIANDEPAPVIHLILETEGFDGLAGVKTAAAERWTAAVNADAQFGAWRYAMVREVADVAHAPDEIIAVMPPVSVSTCFRE